MPHIPVHEEDQRTPAANAGQDGAVVLHSIWKRFGAVTALQDVSFTVQKGEVVALLGPNGAGKTTTISVMLGLSAPTSGTVRLLGQDPRSQQVRSRCGVMLQESGVPMNLSVGELLDLFRSYYPHPLPLARVLDIAGLAEKAKLRAGTLSVGQRQRLYFALALCGDPEVIFLDEPTAALDVEARHTFWQHMRDLARSGKTILFTTHYLEEADALADRVVVIARGQVIADASPADLKARVAGRRVSFDAQFDPTLLEGLPVQRLERDAEHVTLLSPEPEVVLSHLFARGIQIHNLEVIGAGLEEAVLALTHA